MQIYYLIINYWKDRDLQEMDTCMKSIKLFSLYFYWTSFNRATIFFKNIQFCSYNIEKEKGFFSFLTITIKKRHKTKVRECAESEEIPVSEFKTLSSFFPAFKQMQYIKKWDENTSVQYTGVKSIHKASGSNVLLAPLLFFFFFAMLHFFCSLSNIQLLMEKH